MLADDREDGRMPARDVVLRDVAPVRVAELTATAASYGPEDIAAVIRPLYCELLRRLAAAGVTPAAGPAITYYEDPACPADAVIVHAGIPVAAGPPPGGGFAVVVLPAIRPAAVIIHRGGMRGVRQSLWDLAGWIEDHGYLPVGYHREVYLGQDPDDAGRGVTELQVGVTLTAGRGACPARSAGPGR
jgi:effector-binding domain-containing protein